MSTRPSGSAVYGPYNYTPVPYHSNIGKTSRVVSITSANTPFTFTGSFAYPYAIQLATTGTVGLATWSASFSAGGSMIGSAFYAGQVYNIAPIKIGGVVGTTETIYALYQ